MAEILRPARRAFLTGRAIGEWHAEAKCFFRRVSAIPPPAPLFSPFFSGKTEKNGPAEQSPRHSGAEKTSAEAEEIGREGQNLHNLQKSTLDNDRKIRMIILSHNRSIGRREKSRPV